MLSKLWLHNHPTARKATGVYDNRTSSSDSTVYDSIQKTIVKSFSLARYKGLIVQLTRFQPWFDLGFRVIETFRCLATLPLPINLDCGFFSGDTTKCRVLLGVAALWNHDDPSTSRHLSKSATLRTKTSGVRLEPSIRCGLQCNMNSL